LTAAALIRLPRFGRRIGNAYRKPAANCQRMADSPKRLTFKDLTRGLS
jgi:hypothetical protein